MVSTPYKILWITMVGGIITSLPLIPSLFYWASLDPHKKVSAVTNIISVYPSP